MDHELQCKIKNYNTSRKHTGESLQDLGLGRVLRLNDKNTVHRMKN